MREKYENKRKDEERMREREKERKWKANKAESEWSERLKSETMYIEHRNIVIERSWELSIDAHKKWMQTIPERNQSAFLCIFIEYSVYVFGISLSVFMCTFVSQSLHRRAAHNTANNEIECVSIFNDMSISTRDIYTQTQQTNDTAVRSVNKLDRLCLEL